MAEQGGKRPRPADDIDAVIKAELAADMAKRMAKKSSKEPKTKGMTLAQIEDSEGGPIKESMIATAQIKRAALRKKGGKGVADDDADVDMPEDVDQFEEDKAEVEQEGGVKIIPFSLQEERETGHFDEEGNYVEEKENRDDMDAWLDSAEVVDEKLLETIEARKKAEAEAEEAVAKQVCTFVHAAQRQPRPICVMQLQAHYLAMFLNFGAPISAHAHASTGHSHAPGTRVTDFSGCPSAY
uniref:GYF domain-containing protein n=1 Tax=Chlamydomonas euryale TaxID=1486919 RepID=A0A6U2DWJ2_9CHLO|mmetsp:Transcript_2183/g.5760  ORF Transcript_2183/g.5760 Transcript_2183/m.5760 type:complete len:240 (+) Transcript_2183:93-812(+)